MATKSDKKERFYLLLTLFVIALFLLLLFFLYTRKQEMPVANKETLPVAENVEEAFLQLEFLRRQPDFMWPLNERGEAIQLVKHRALGFGYSEKHEQAAWVAYLLSKQHSDNLHNRRNNFRADPAVRSGSASPSDYANSGYDRGHLAPAADFDFNQEALSESFLMSNISPQLPAFNRGSWKELEELVRSWASREDSLYIITGPILTDGLKKIGGNRVSVPDYFYKIILDARQAEVKMISFLMPNKKSSKALHQWVVSVDSVEVLSGLDFFPQLPNILEDSLEGSLQTDYWLLTNRR